MRVLFVCTGNTCRSPMAEAVFRHLASQRLKCREDRLHEHGIDVLSAGVAAPNSAPASQHAINVLKAQGIDMSHHLSQPVTDDMLTHSDYVFTMTPAHLQVLQSARPDVADRMRTLRPDGRAIADPIGGDYREYEQCAAEITSCLEPILDDILRKDSAEK